MYTFNESDWKLFRQRIAVWQENHMERLCREYIELLSGDRKVRKSGGIWKNGSKKTNGPAG